MFQKDYWKISDEELHDIALKYHISPMSLPHGTNDLAEAYVDRERIIEVLVTRDNALRTKLTTVLSIFAILLSIASFVKSFLVPNSN